jgi:hypothetical protein
MIARRGSGQRFSLARWSQRKLEATQAAPAPPATAPPASAPAPAAAATAPVELPPVESLTFDSDFTAFLRPEVDDQVKRAALKQLFRDPRFNVMDGLDTYIDDYTQADPIAPDVLADLLQRGLFGAPQAPEQPAEAAPQAAAASTAAARPSLPDTPAAALPSGPAASGEAACAPGETEKPDAAPRRAKPTGAPS